MASLREIRRKIKSVQSTRQITRAMKMVAAARMRRAQSSILASRPFALRMEETIHDLAHIRQSHAGEGNEKTASHPFFEARPGTEACLILVTADRGLCGSFNTSAIRAGLEWIRNHRDRKIVVAAVGRRGREVLRRLRGVEMGIIAELVGIFPKVSFAHAELLGKAVSKAYLEGGCGTVDVIYNEFRSVAVQRVATSRLLPIPEPQEGDRERLRGFKFEPNREELLAALLPRYFKAQLYRILLESQAAELAARMNAMDTAAKNAGEFIDTLTLRLNRTRQGIITREIAEIVGGAEALAA